MNGVTTEYVYDGWDILRETTAGVTTDYTHTLNIDEPLALERSDGTIRYYKADALGSIIALTDENGAVTTSYAYDAFGNVTVSGSDANAIQYTGRENDGTGLYYYRARYYSPGMRRFINEDPIRLFGGINSYAYVQNNPVNWIDPSGLFGITVGFEGAAAAFGFGGMGGIYGNFAHNPSLPWYQGWSSSVTIIAGGGAAASVAGVGGGVHIGGNNACDVDQLNGPFINAGRAGLGAVSVGGFRSLDGSVSGGGVTVGPSLGYIGAIGGGTYTWTLGGGKW